MKMPRANEVFDTAYTLQAIIGAGGFGTVYSALDPSGRRVAVKIIKPEGPQYLPNTVARFEREVGILDQLRSPHSVRLLGHGRANGLLYMVFEYLEGQDLSDLLSERRTLDAESVRHIVGQVLRALHEAHGLGLLHRDIKPENIRLLNRAGDPLFVKLLDFGIARAAVPTSKITKTGALIGTPRYMSPEQLRGEPLTPASDLYSLGVVAFEMLAGPEAMHGGSIVDQLQRVAFSQALVVPESTEAVLREVIHRLVARTPSKRFATAREVLAALGEQQAQEPRRMNAPEPAARAWGAVVVALVVIALAGIRLFTREPAPEPIRSPRTITETTEPKKKVPVVEDELPTADIDAGMASDAMQLVVAPVMPPERYTTGCGNEPADVDLPPGSEGVDRVLTITAPNSYDKDRPYPVVLLLADAIQTSKQVVEESEIKPLVHRHEFVVVSPRTVEHPPAALPRSVDRAVEALTLAGEHYCLDLERVYAIGVGRGGRVVEGLQCAVPYLAGVATVSSRSKPSPRCVPNPPIPYIHFTGLKDGYYPPSGGPAIGCGGDQTISIEGHESLWRTQNGCSGPSEVFLQKDDATCLTWDCEKEFVSCHVDAGRGWRASKPRDLDKATAFLQALQGATTEGADCAGPRPKLHIAEVAWQFFEGVTPPEPR